MKNKSIKVSINILFVGMIITFAVIVIGFNYNSGLKNSYELSEKIINQTSNNVIKQTMQYIHKTDTTLKILTINNNTNNIFDNEVLNEDIMWNLVLSEGHIASVFLADENKNFYQVRREPRLAIRKIQKIDNKRIDTYIHKTPNQVTTDYKISIASYDPTSRTWFKTTNENKINVSKPYIFASTKKTGITVSYANLDPFKNKLVVGAIDITLDTLTNFVKEQAQNIGGKIYLMDEDSNFITSSSEKLNKEFSENTEFNVNNDNLFFQLQKNFFREKLKGTIEAKDDNYLYAITRVQISDNKYWHVIAAIPEHLILGRTKQVLLITIFVSLFFVIVFIFIATRFSKLISEPIKDLTDDIQDLKDLKTNSKIIKNSKIKEIANAQRSLLALQKGLESFKKYMPADLVKLLVDTGQETRIGGSEKHLAVMFTDIAGFTTISEKLTPKELTEQLAVYFDRLESVISKHLGTIDKYIGDAIMAFWGAPVRINDPLGKAVSCAIEMQKELDILNAKWEKEGKAVLHTRIGVHYGPTLVGNIGSPNRMNYTIIGDTVNIAARLEAINKQYGTKIMVSNEVYEILKDRFELRYVDELELKGKTTATKIFEVLDNK